MRIPVPTRLVTGAVFTVALTVASTAALAAQSSGAPTPAPSSPAARAAITSPLPAPRSTTRPAPARTRTATLPARRPSTTPSHRPTPRPTIHAAPAAQPAAQEVPVQHNAPRPASAAPRTTHPAPAPSTSQVHTTAAPAPVVSASNFAWAILSTLNAERAAHGLPALRMNSDLISSAHAHNLAMAAADTLSHQLPGEPSLGPRILDAGYHYYYAGENVAWTTDESVTGVVDTHIAMYNEVPPNDGHRQNILSPNYRDVGIDVVIDAAHGKAWITEDFGSQQ